MARAETHPVGMRGAGDGDGSWAPRAARLSLLVLGLLLALPLGGCYTRRMERMEGSLDTLRMDVTDLRREQEAALGRLQEELEEQENLLHSLRAGTNVASQDLIDRIEELSAKLDDTAERIARMTRRYVAPVASEGSPGDTTAAALSGADAQTMYEQAARDFTQGRFELALAEFRGLLQAYPDHELADNAQYGVGESFYALAQYDSARVAYEAVVERYPGGDKVPASLYKLGMTYQKMERAGEAKKAFQRLREEHPRSGEAALAEERLRELER